MTNTTDARRLADQIGYACLSIHRAVPVTHAGHPSMMIWMKGMGDDVAVISRDGTRRWWVYRGIAPQRAQAAWDGVLQGRWDGLMRR